MQRRKSAQCVLEDSLDEHDRQILLGQAQEMIGEVFEDKHRLLWDKVFQRADIGTAAHTAVLVLVIRKIKVRDIFQYEFLFAGPGSPELSNLDCDGR